MSWIISRPFQDIFELISRTFLPKNVEEISNFKETKEMEQQSSFQISINLSFLNIFIFQDILHDSKTFQDIFFSLPGPSRKWESCHFLSNLAVCKYLLNRKSNSVYLKSWKVRSHLPKIFTCKIKHSNFFADYFLDYNIATTIV